VGRSSSRAPILATSLGLALALAAAACQGSSAGGSSAESASAASDQAAESRTISVYDLAVDDCWNGAATNVTEVDVVPCDAPHTYQAFHLLEHSADEYPGVDTLMGVAEDECLAVFPDYVGRDFETSEFSVYPLVPSESTWGEGDREIVCNLALPDDSDWTGSGKDSRR
jgi:hypothetical protein